MMAPETGLCIFSMPSVFLLAMCEWCVVEVLVAGPVPINAMFAVRIREDTER